MQRPNIKYNGPLEHTEGGFAAGRPGQADDRKRSSGGGRCMSIASRREFIGNGRGSRRRCAKNRPERRDADNSKSSLGGGRCMGIASRRELIGNGRWSRGRGAQIDQAEVMRIVFTVFVFVFLTAPFLKALTFFFGSWEPFGVPRGSFLVMFVFQTVFSLWQSGTVVCAPY